MAVTWRRASGGGGGEADRRVRLRGVLLAAAALACLCLLIPNKQADQSDAVQSLWGGGEGTRERRPDHYPGISYFAKQREEEWDTRHDHRQTSSETVRGPNNQKLTGNQARIAKQFQALRLGEEAMEITALSSIDIMLRIAERVELLMHQWI
eukprot:765407-Hanusia_phi.AAC.3